jgi:hypothetical protein
MLARIASASRTSVTAIDEQNDGLRVRVNASSGASSQMRRSEWARTLPPT